MNIRKLFMSALVLTMTLNELRLGAANTLEPKFMKGGMGSQNLVVSQAVKRATISCVKNLIV